MTLPGFPSRRRFLAVAAPLVAGPLAAWAAPPADAPLEIPVPPSHELWVVSSRAVSSSAPPEETAKLRYWRLADGAFAPSNVAEFLAGDSSDRPTIFYIHGNRESSGEVFLRSQLLLRGFAAQMPNPEGPLRLVAFSWPSDQIPKRPLQDVRIKAQRSEAHAFLLAWLLNQMDGAQDVGLFGFSYGARMITAALHMLAGGRANGHSPPEPLSQDRRAYRVALIAAALDSHWLEPSQKYGLALSQVERLVNLQNDCDPALKWYPMICGKGGPPALGYEGVRSVAALGEYRERFAQVDVSGIVGKEHNFDGSVRLPEILSLVTPMLLGQSSRI